VAIVVFLDGVLRTDKKVPIFEGVALYKSLNVNGTVAIACDDKEEAARWCKEHKLNDTDGFIDNKTIGEYENKDLLKVQHQQAQGPVHLVITANVDLATTLLENGIKTLLFLHPVYLSAKFRPDGRSGRKSWDDLVNELDNQVTMLLEDKRV
jgi:hypothetical protein